MEAKVYSNNKLEVAIKFKKDEGFVPDNLPLTVANTVVQHGGKVVAYKVSEDGGRLLCCEIPEYLYELLKVSLMEQYMEETIDNGKYLFITL